MGPRGQGKNTGKKLRVVDWRHDIGAFEINSAADGNGVSLVGIRRSIKDQVIIPDLNLHIHRGEFFSILGPSGCGKTTTLRMIAGFDAPDRGRLLIDGRDVTALRPYERPVNLVFQSYALFPHLSVFKNVAFGLEMERLKKPEIQVRVTEALDLVQMGEFASRMPSQLSGGQQQRVALARAIVKRPPVLLLDEPIGALDLKLRTEMQFELKRLQRQLGITFIYVTHDQAEALAMSDRIAVFNLGQIEQVGTPEEIYMTPCNQFVADFIGATNWLDIDLSLGRADNILDCSGWKFKIADSKMPHLPKRASVRPEKLSIAKHGEPAMWIGEVAETIYNGDSSLVHIRLASGQTLRVKAEKGFGASGQSVGINCQAHDLNFFEEGGKRLDVDILQ